MDRKQLLAPIDLFLMFMNVNAFEF